VISSPALVDLGQLAYLTGDEPGIGGRIKARPEDFLVEEVPLYPPTGEGEHLYLVVEKRRRLTTDLVRLLAQHFGVRREVIGFAGLKDKHAVTRQCMTIHHGDIDKARTFADGHIRILAAERHRNKIRRGHLKANRFVIKVREVEPAHAPRAKRLMDRLVRFGVPNYYGEQRFGYRRNNHTLGKLLLLRRYQEFLDQMLGQPRDDESPKAQDARRAYDEGDYPRALKLWPTVHRFERQACGPLSRNASPEQAINGIDHTQLTLLISSFQSEIFNRVVDRRLRDGLYDRVLVGDLAFKHTTRGLFMVLDADHEQPRCDALEISPTGPLWGPDMVMPNGQVIAWERQALAATGVSEEQLVIDGPYAPGGSRRAMRMLVADPDVGGGADEHGPYIRIAFELSRGCFATTVLREITKAGAS
jgi:tRNA pseudouridine13 synthase